MSLFLICISSEENMGYHTIQTIVSAWKFVPNDLHDNLYKVNDLSVNDFYVGDNFSHTQWVLLPEKTPLDKWSKVHKQYINSLVMVDRHKKGCIAQKVAEYT